ncbi:hypothetical protein OHB14_59710 [Streptomyces sp. NBC_01613]|uniref:hypothetical protein n=1 Tax=Streptomyces sp. NBC_01613 TaxID=2975896 RepID=UPI0038701BFE
MVGEQGKPNPVLTTDGLRHATVEVNTMRQVGQVFGVAVPGSLAFGQVPGGHVRTAADRTQFVTGLHHALLVCGRPCSLPLPLSAALLFRRPSAGSGTPAATVISLVQAGPSRETT